MIHWLKNAIIAHWLSLLLIVGMLAAVCHMLKYRKKFEKNEFE